MSTIIITITATTTTAITTTSIWMVQARNQGGGLGYDLDYNQGSRFGGSLDYVQVINLDDFCQDAGQWFVLGS